MAAMYNLGEEYVEVAFVSIQPKDNKIAANDLIPNHSQIPIIYKWSYYIAYSKVSGISWKYGRLSAKASRKNSIFYTS
jgi:hypothetical protein